MQEWRQSPWSNPARWYMLGGLVLLGVTLWAPWYTAARTARVEQRAEHIAELLLAVTRGLEITHDAAGKELLFARFQALAAADGVFVADIERLEPNPPAVLLCLTNKHYAFQLAASTDARTSKAPANALPLEVIAWPLTDAGPGHSAWFLPSDAPRAYSRNLGASYSGTGSGRPTPGHSHRRPDKFDEKATTYRGIDDELWIHY